MANSVEIDSIGQAALKLHPGARVRLAHSLVNSLTDLSPADLEGLWVAEAKRRDAEMESGSVTGVPGEQVFADIEARYRK